MFRTIVVAFSCASFALVFSTRAQAAAIEVAFEGIVNRVDAALAGEFAVNESIVGTYTYESTTADADPGNANIGAYAGAVTAFAATIGGDYTLGLGSANDLSIVNNNASDSYGVDIFDPAGAVVNGHDATLFAILLVDSTASVFASDALSETTPDLLAFDDDFSFALFFDGGMGAETVEFSLTSLNVVPEPGTCGLTLLAVAALCLRQPRRG